MKSNLKKYTKKEVLRHNKQHDCWVIINNFVYDLTLFIKRHPGGKDIILARAGEDTTSYFSIKHGLDEKIISKLNKYKIGILKENERVFGSITEETFMKDLLTSIKKNNLYEVKKSVQLKFAIYRIVSILLFFTISLFVIYSEISILLKFILIVIQAFIGTSLFGIIAHESTHRNFPRSTILKILLEFMWPFMWPFISKRPLTYEHNSHHIKIGDEDFDYEVAAFSELIRYSSSIKLKPIHKHQRKIAIFLYPFYANIITTLGGVKSGFWKKHNRKVLFYHTMSLIFTFSYYIIIPSFLIEFSFNLIIYYLFYQCILFSGIYVGAAINHFIPNSLEKLDQAKNNNYGYYVCANTSNFGTKNSFWFWYTGGFNIQIEHHLVPFIPVENLKSLIPIVKNLCKKYNYPYIEFKKFSDLWSAHYHYLDILGKNKIIQNENKNKKNYQAR